MNHATLIIMEIAAVAVGALLIAQRHGWQMGLAIGLIAWALLPHK
jgi:hypothetical protein